MSDSNLTSSSSSQSPTSTTNRFVECLQNECYWGILMELYSQVRLPLAVLICTVGSVMNIINFVIFTRPKMRTPVNTFLASLSVAQFLFTIDYFFLALLEYFRALCYPFVWSYAFTLYKAINVNVNVVLHAVIFSHILAVTAFRIRSMQPPIQLNQFLYGNDWALSSVGMIWFFSPMFCIPVYFISSLSQAQNSTQNQCQFDWITFEHRNVEDRLLVGTVYWMFGVALKLLPCLFAIFLFLALVKLPLSSEEFRRRLRDSHNEQQQRKVSSTSSKKSASLVATNHHPTLTLACLLAVAFLIEFPHGLYNLYFAMEYYHFDFSLLTRGQSSLVLEFLILLQHTLSFPIYYLTLVQFRETLHWLLNRNDRIKLENDKPLSKKRAADSVMLMKEKRKRKLTKASDFDEESVTAKTSIVTRPHGPYPTIIISSNETRNITKLTF